MTEIVIEQRDELGNIILTKKTHAVIIWNDEFGIPIEDKNIPALISALQKIQGKKNWREEFDQLMDSVTDEEFINWATENIRKKYALQQLTENPKTK